MQLLEEFLPEKLEISMENLPEIPTLDLLEIFTLAEDIEDEPLGRQATRFAGQILDYCEGRAGDEIGRIRAEAEAIRATRDKDARIAAAGRILETVSIMLSLPAGAFESEEGESENNQEEPDANTM